VIFLWLGNHSLSFSQEDDHALTRDRSTCTQLIISVRDQQGNVLLAHQVSTRPARILLFFRSVESC
ncbi:MAG TPA: hypothetical protein DD473_03325, partial [Planctomycetaceae bacterium]|nr:hypothetical protein [Planctomycetaceae bacterium]